MDNSVPEHLLVSAACVTFDAELLGLRRASVSDTGMSAVQPRGSIYKISYDLS